MNFTDTKEVLEVADELRAIAAALETVANDPEQKDTDKWMEAWEQLNLGWQPIIDHCELMANEFESVDRDDLSSWLRLAAKHLQSVQDE